MELQTPWSSLLANEPNLCDFQEHTILIRHVDQDAKGEKSTCNQLHTSLCICALIYIYIIYTPILYTYIHIYNNIIYNNIIYNSH